MNTYKAFLIISKVMRRRLFGGRNSNHPKKRGRFTTGAALLVAGLALGFGCKGRTQEKRLGTVEQTERNRDPTAPPIKGMPPYVPPTTKRKTVRRGDILFYIEDGFDTSPFMRVHRVGPKSLILRPHRSGSMTGYEHNVFATAMGVRIGHRGIMIFLELPFGVTRKFRFEDWSMTIRADRGRKVGTARVKATVSGIRIR